MQRNITRRDFLRIRPSTTRDGGTSTVATHYTSNSAFYRQQLRHVPQVDPAYWALSLGGMVSKPLVMRHDDLMALPAVEVPATLACVGSTPGSPLIGHARWRGVPLTALLDQIEPDPQASYAQFYSADGYTTFIERSRLSQALLAYQMNGEPLPPEHGFPLRLVVPGLYGYKMPKWIQRIQMAETPVNGFWEDRGWSASGEAQTISGILSPRHLETVSGDITFSGFAYAGDRRVTGVEISIDDAPWMPVPFTPAEANCWTTWTITWTPPAPGDYLVKVRATDSDGFIQPEDAQGHPKGTAAVQRMIVRLSA